MTQSPETTRPNLDRPLLLFKTGILGSSHLDTAKEIANRYNTAFISSDAIRLDMINGIDRQQRRKKAPTRQPHSINLNDIRRRAMHEAHEHLLEGRDVVLDMYFNTANSRTTPARLAREVGATSVALFIKTSPETAKRRVKQWMEKDLFTVPQERWDISPLDVVDSMQKHMTNPTVKEPLLDHVITLKGAQGLKSLLASFDEKLSALKAAQSSAQK